MSLSHNRFHVLLQLELGWLKHSNTRNLLKMVSRFFNQDNSLVMHLEKACRGDPNEHRWRWRRVKVVVKRRTRIILELLRKRRRRKVLIKRYTFHPSRRLNSATCFRIREIVAYIKVQSCINTKEVNRAVEVKSLHCGIIHFRLDTDAFETV